MIRTAGRAIAAGVATAITAFAAAVILFIYLLSQGPISLNFLTPHIKNVLETIDSKIDFEIDNTILSWQGWDRQLDIRLVGVVILDLNGRELARVPEMSVGLDALGLWRGEILPQSLEMFGPKIQLKRDSDESIYVGVGFGDETDSGNALFELLEDVNSNSSTNSVFDSLTEIIIHKADVKFSDAITGLQIHAPDATFQVSRLSDGVGINLSSRIEVGNIAAEVNAGLIYRGRDADIPISVAFFGVDAENALNLLGVLDNEKFALTDLIANGTVRADVTAAGVLQKIDFDVRTSAGTIQIEEYSAAPYRVDGLAAQGSLSGDFSHLELRKVKVNLPKELAIDATGSLDFADGLSGLDLTGQFYNVITDDVSKYWPGDLAPDGRKWVAQHLSKGKISDAIWSVKLTAEELDTGKYGKDFFKIDFDYQGIRVDYLPPMPILDAARGSGSLRINSYSMRIDSASHQDLKVTKGSLNISSFSRKIPQLKIAFQVDGSIPTGLTVINSEPLTLGQTLSLTPANVKGQMRTNVSLNIPLKDNIDGPDIDYVVTSKLSKASALGLVDEFDVGDADIDLTANRQGVTAKGNGLVNNLAATFSVVHKFSAKNTATTDKIVASTTLSPQQQKDFGLDLAPRVFGPIDLTATATRAGEAPFLVDVAADLQATTIELPVLQWRKKKGEPTSVRFQTVVDGQEQIKLEKLNIQAADFDVTGRLEFGEKFAFKRFQASKLKINTQDLTADVQLRENGTLVIKLGGEVLDLRQIIDELEKEGERGIKIPNIRFTSNINKILVTEDVAMHEAILSVLWQGEHLETVKAWGKVNGGPPVRIDLISKGKRRHLEVNSKAGGEVFRAMDMFHNVYAGKLHLEAEIPADPTREDPIVGYYRLEDFVVAKAATLGEVLHRGKFIEFVDELSGDGITFTRMEIPFTYAEDRLRIDELRAVGPSFGVTLHGIVNRSSRALDLQGTIIPAYTLNSMLGNIPIIGRLLTGGEVGGVFAVTYRIKGTFDKPETSVSKLSAFAPGFLRNIIDSLDAPAMDDEDEELLKNPDKERQWP